MEFILAAVLAVIALVLLLAGSRQQRESGLPAGRVLYSDPKVIGAPEKPLFDADALLTGKPDYLVEEKGALIPVEVKSGWAPPEPYEGHVYQLLAYCRLVEHAEGKRPPYGILRYRNRSFAVDYPRGGEQELPRVQRGAWGGHTRCRQGARNAGTDRCVMRRCSAACRVLHRHTLRRLHCSQFISAKLPIWKRAKWRLPD
jgi:CRISPR-associated exonuclease Cas4